MADAGSRVGQLEREVLELQAEVNRLREENRRWAKLAGTDGLTGLPNRISFFRAFLPQTLQLAVKEERPVGLILLSPDSLGDLNESFGREAGDEVVKGLGQLVQSLVGDEAKLGHVDGANFCLMLYPGEMEAVRGRANMVRARVRTHEFPCSGSVAQITVSAGISSVVPTEGSDFRSLSEEYFSDLNKALHSAKKAGGNRVEVVSSRGD
jgi:diguanylate cyclase (GGDEF)-like protein